MCLYSPTSQHKTIICRLVIQSPHLPITLPIIHALYLHSFSSATLILLFGQTHKSTHSHQLLLKTIPLTNTDVCMNVQMYKCINVCKHAHVRGCMHVCIMHIWIDGCIDVRCMMYDVCMDAGMHMHCFSNHYRDLSILSQWLKISSIINATIKVNEYQLPHMAKGRVSRLSALTSSSIKLMELVKHV